MLSFLSLTSVKVYPSTFVSIPSSSKRIVSPTTYFDVSASSTVSLSVPTNSTFNVPATSGCSSTGVLGCSSTGAAGCSSTGAADCSSTGALGSGVPISDDGVSSAASPVESLGPLSGSFVT